jgi:hypothetical protein
MAAIFIGEGYFEYEMGQVGFLIERENVNKGGKGLRLSDHPPITNLSHQPRLHGWCGTTNDVAVYARGMAKVVRVCKNGRAQVAKIEGDELKAALNDFGYPDLGEAEA